MITDIGMKTDSGMITDIGMKTESGMITDIGMKTECGITTDSGIKADSRIKIKICGLSRQLDIEYANQVQPDYIGFVFAPSRRQVSFRQAADLRGELHPNIDVVGVFVDAAEEEIISCCRSGIIDIVQLHGRETEQDICRIQNAAGVPVIKAVKVESPGDVEAWLSSSADYLLFDSGQGTGQTFEWSHLMGLDRKFFLAGGLHSGNLKEACCKVRPYCADVSSGAETEGRKNLEKMRELVEIIHRLEEK